MSDTRGAALFSLRNLEAVFDGHTVLSVDELRIHEGGITVLVGENGSGKTTLLRLLNGLQEPSAGAIDFRGARIAPYFAGDATGARASLRSDSVLVHQSPLLFRGSVAQNVGYGLRIRGVARDEASRRTTRALQRVGLRGFEGRRASRLSGGERQRVALARALVLATPVLLLDEPTANVDRDSRVVIEAILREAAAAGVTVIMSSHETEIAYRLCDTLVRLAGGRIKPSEENVLKGDVERVDEQFTRFRVTQGKGAATGAGPVLLCPARQGSFRVAVLSMNELILSRKPLASSARNELRGIVRSIERWDGLLLVAVDCGVELRALITPAAAEEIHVAAGQEIVVTFKASAVRLY